MDATGIALSAAVCALVAASAALWGVPAWQRHRRASEGRTGPRVAGRDLRAGMLVGVPRDPDDPDAGDVAVRVVQVRYGMASGWPFVAFDHPDLRGCAIGEHDPACLTTSFVSWDDTLRLYLS